VTAGITIREAGHDDLDAIRRLLERNALPTADLATSRPAFLVAEGGPGIVGAGGLEAFGATGLLRSVVVEESMRGTGLGHALVDAVERAAGRRGLTELVLLTETAREFFAGLGYAEIARGAVPAALRESAEFRSLCPQTARCMRKRLGAGRDGPNRR
jgi:N-acetylglutamate synthase-like GNAT family acetyltransferase